MSGKTVLVTGINGFIAAHTVEQLLAAGYYVRGTIRTPKLDTIKDVPSNLTLIAIDDVASGDFSEALKGVDAVVHIASPLPGAKSREETFKSAVDGTLNVVRQSQKAGVKKIVVTSSFGALLHPNHMPAFAGLTFTEENWGDIPDEEFEQNKEDPLIIYMTAKTRAEKALWAFAKEHPELEVSTILPGYVIGPYSRLFPLPTTTGAIGTNERLYEVITKKDAPFAPNWLVDVRDIAKAHVLALSLPAGVGAIGKTSERRFTVNAKTYTWKQAAEYLKGKREDVKERIVPIEEIKPLPGVLSNLDTTRVKDVLGLKEYISVEKTLDDTVDDLLAAEKNWVKA